jgi:hypothetical protein
MAIRKKVGGNTKKLSINPSARSSIKAQQKTALKDYKYDLQAKLRQDITGPKSGAVASQGRLSSFKTGARNTATTKPAVKSKNAGIKKKKKK